MERNSIEEIKDLLAEAEAAINELRNETTSQREADEYSEVHRHISEALTALGRV